MAERSQYEPARRDAAPRAGVLLKLGSLVVLIFSAWLGLALARSPVIPVEVGPAVVASTKAPPPPVLEAPPPILEEAPPPPALEAPAEPPGTPEATPPPPPVLPPAVDEKSPAEASPASQQLQPIYAMIFPLAGDGVLTGSFGDPRSGGRKHEGEDIMAPKLTPVVAVAAGKVEWMQAEIGGRCCALSLRHDDGWRSRYIHLNNDTPGTDDGRGYGIAEGLERGVRVEAGTVIGWVGDSGNAEHTPPHLHFELRRPNRRPINPYPSLLEAAMEAAEQGYEIQPSLPLPTVP